MKKLNVKAISDKIEIEGLDYYLTEYTDGKEFIGTEAYNLFKKYKESRENLLNSLTKLGINF